MGGNEKGAIAPSAGRVFFIFFIKLLGFGGDGAMGAMIFSY
jgi:hypothetical protein